MKEKTTKQLKFYFRWPFWQGFLLLIASGVIFIFDTTAGIAVMALTAVYFAVTMTAYSLFKKKIAKKVVQFAEDYSDSMTNLNRKTLIPTAVVADSGRVFWKNEAFSHCFSDAEEINVLELFREMEGSLLTGDATLHIAFKEKKYRIDLMELERRLAYQYSEVSTEAVKKLFLLHAKDETELLEVQKTLKEERCIIGMLCVDNYEEAVPMDNDMRRAVLTAELEQKLGAYFAKFGGVIRKTEKDRFFLVFRQQALFDMQADKFSILEQIKAIETDRDIPLTISIGIGTNEESYARQYESARKALEMALARGGDQIVLKNGPDIQYFGGKAQGTEHNTRVKARVRAHALRDLIERSENVLIMGHPISDLDCMGAMIGLMRAAKYSKKRAYLVFDEVSNDVKPLIQMIREDEEYGKGSVLTVPEAMETVGEKSLVITVDTNRPSYTVAPELLEEAGTVVVIDHHRQGREVIENPALSYVEPYASSASELVTEILAYYGSELTLRPQEADILLAGIVMDTNNFENKAGVRTFEAAAFLRRSGADVTHVRKMFRDSLEDYKLRAETMSRAEVYKEDYIISICPGYPEPKPGQTVVAAQAANELLEIRGIKASFVLTECDGKIYLSARSIDEVNVQTMMEKLGGGGHMSVAGAQFTDITLEEALQKLKDIIDEEEQ